MGKPLSHLALRTGTADGRRVELLQTASDAFWILVENTGPECGWFFYEEKNVDRLLHFFEIDCGPIEWEQRP